MKEVDQSHINPSRVTMRSSPDDDDELSKIAERLGRSDPEHIVEFLDKMAIAMGLPHQGVPIQGWLRLSLHLNSCRCATNVKAMVKVLTHRAEHYDDLAELARQKRKLDEAYPESGTDPT
jgi:hypothetical protein